MAIVLPMVAAFMLIGLLGKRLDGRTYFAMILAIVVVTAFRYIKG